MSKEKSNIGETIKKYRLQKRISQDKLSKLADVAFHTVVKIESGNIRWSGLSRHGISRNQMVRIF